MYYLLRYYKEEATACGTVLDKSCSRIYNSRQIHLQRVTEEILKRNTLLFRLLALSIEMK